MRKLLIVFLFVFVLFFGVSQANIENQTSCVLEGFTSSQTEYMLQVYNLVNNNEEKIQDKFPGTEMITYIFIEKINNTLNCNYEGDYFVSYMDFEKSFYNFILNLSSSQVEQVEQEEQIDIEYDGNADKYILYLQKHLVNLLVVDMDFEKIMDFDEKMNYSFDFSVKDDNFSKSSRIKGELNIADEGKIDVKNNKMDLDIDVDGSIDFDGYTKTYDTGYNLVFEPLKFDASLKSMLKMIADSKDMFINLEEFDFDINVQEISKQNELQIKMITNTINSVLDTYKGRNLKISTANTDFSRVFGLSFYYNILSKLQKESMMKFYKKDNMTWYGIIDPKFCEIFDGYSKKDCENDIKKLNKSTNYKGYLVLKKNYDNYTLGISDEFLDQKFPVDYSKIITWNSSKITDIFIPLGEDHGNVKYSNNELNINYYETGDFVFAMQGELGSSKNLFDFQIDIENQNIKINGELSFVKKYNSFDFDGNMKIIQDTVEIGTINIGGESNIRYIDSFDVDIPTDYIEIDDIQKSFDLGSTF